MRWILLRKLRTWKKAESLRFYVNYFWGSLLREPCAKHMALKEPATDFIHLDQAEDLKEYNGRFKRTFQRELGALSKTFMLPTVPFACHDTDGCELVKLGHSSCATRLQEADQTRPVQYPPTHILLLSSFQRFLASILRLANMLSRFSHQQKALKGVTAFRCLSMDNISLNC